VAEVMLPFIYEHFGNPSSSHFYGVNAKKAVEEARSHIAEMLHCEIEEVVFTSGGSESNNYAIKGAAFANRHKGNHIITTSIEHPAVLEVCAYLEMKGFRVTYLPVDEKGLVRPEQVEEAITPTTILLTVMHANNEVGTVEPLGEIADIARRHDILVHTDAAQSVGKIPVRVDEMKVDLLSIAGHKLYAPKGIGALFVRSGTVLEKLIHGAGHERNRRAGTENTIELVGLGKACRLIGDGLENYMNHMRMMRDRLEAGLIARLPDLRVNGHLVKRLPNTSSIGFWSLVANDIISALPDIAVSSGAACHSDGVNVSPVLKEMHVPREYAMGTIRFSVGRYTSETEIDRVVERVADVVAKQRRSLS
jgi:cysteine desulfurase